eukprot:TRINITY_DN3318_c0_g3_i2.p1 TRINITY_DN3318_c0_g3~~TRINITY_DN3318_c0_g3_i2.p1  ORF type:complete len:285 (+),score=32.21 TRINITY_DN3318_c0_g3_i2:68-856(+)
MAVVDRLLTVAGVDAAAHDNGAIIIASLQGHLAIVERLLAVPGVDVTARKNRAILAAAFSGHLVVMDRLIAAAGIDASTQNKSVLEAAVFNRHFQVVERLLTLPGMDARAAARLAIKRGYLYLLETLLTHPTSVEVVDVDPLILKSPLTRHLLAMRYCWSRDTAAEWRNDVPEMYRLAYSVVASEEGVPVGVSELICSYVTTSCGLVMWTLQVHRQLRQKLNQLKQFAQYRISNNLKRCLPTSKLAKSSTAKKRKSSQSKRT